MTKCLLCGKEVKKEIKSIEVLLCEEHRRKLADEVFGDGKKHTSKNG